MNNFLRFSFSCFALLGVALQGLSIEEKKRQCEPSKVPVASASGMNTSLERLERDVQAVCAAVAHLHEVGGEEGDYRKLLTTLQALRNEKEELQESWRREMAPHAEGYGLWDQEETTLSQLVMEYGAPDYLYIVPPEIGGMKLVLHSAVPIPRASWSELLELLLAQNGVSVKEINPCVRQLVISKQDPSAVRWITSEIGDLEWMAPHDRVLFVLAPPVENGRSCFQFFERFADSKQSAVHLVGGKIALIAPVNEVKKLLSVYHKVWEEGRGKVSRVVPITKVSVKEMEKILLSFFGETVERVGSRVAPPRPDSEGLMILPSASSNHLILIGQKEVVDRAEQVVRETEQQLQNPSEMTVFLYQCRHSDPNELAQILQKVYVSLLTTSPVGAGENMEVTYTTQGPGSKPPPDTYAATPPLVIQPPPLRPGFSAKTEVDKEFEHFIPDPKTGSILMAVRKDSLLQIADLLRKIDVPKKMVQIEVLLFEKKIRSENNFGLNLLRIGSESNRVQYDGLFAPMGKGVLSFLFEGSKSKHFPAYDITYSFLMTQEDVQLNAAPSVVTVNQTPATITIQDEISINNGAAAVDTSKGTSFERSFTRQQYGINILITPFIHAAEKGWDGKEETGFVTLQTDITFDSPRPDPINDRPRVERRHVKNEVRVADGQMVILGGLRKKTTKDDEERVPFLGEIPGLGKLFGSTRLTEDKTEMFIFITPKILYDPEEQMLQFRNEEVQKRPGDLPEFMERVAAARKREQNRYFRKSIQLFFTSP